jgi:hypothetical protein
VLLLLLLGQRLAQCHVLLPRWRWLHREQTEKEATVAKVAQGNELQ